VWDYEFFGNTKVPDVFALARVGVRTREVFGNYFVIYFRLHPDDIGFQAKIYQTGVVSGSHENQFPTGNTDEGARR
jgi:hypothetical protein